MGPTGGSREEEVAAAQPLASHSGSRRADGSCAWGEKEGEKGERSSHHGVDRAKSDVDADKRHGEQRVDDVRSDLGEQMGGFRGREDVHGERQCRPKAGKMGMLTVREEGFV